MCQPSQLQFEVKVMDVTVHKRRPKAFVPPPMISQHGILLAGFVVFLSGLMWVPSVLVLCYGVSQLVPYSFRVTDEGVERRKAYAEFLNNPAVPVHLRTTPDDVQLEESYRTNSRGMLLYTSIMTPKYQEAKAVLCFCHGYSDNASFLTRYEYMRFVREGIAVIAIEYEGHGRSDGPSGLIYDWKQTVEDVVSFFDDTVRTRFAGKKAFLMGESMGGAISFSAYNRRPQLFAGVVFVAPMCKISDAMKPDDWVLDICKVVSGPQGSNPWFGYLPIAPTGGNMGDLTFKIPYKRDLADSCPTGYYRNPRLTTARELFLATLRITKHLEDFEAPFLVMHGKDDLVTDPQLSQALFESSKSRDKDIRLYDGMWHSITCGEAEEDIDLVFKDAIDWIQRRL